MSKAGAASLWLTAAAAGALVWAVATQKPGGRSGGTAGAPGRPVAHDTPVVVPDPAEKPADETVGLGMNAAQAAPTDKASPAAAPATGAPPAVPTPLALGHSVAPLVDRVKSSVVAIHSTKIIQRVVREDPFMELLRQRMGVEAPSRNEVQRGLGSGFIIDVKGTVLTNNHVVAGADELEVQLDDGRKLSARVVGADPRTDVAVVRIQNPPRDLSPVKLGDSERVRVGDYVLAIGNPLGLGRTVTMGIVSAKNRSIGTDLGDMPARFQDFIQTDAAINQGNSGGPLYNFEGEVIGVNSAILNPAVAMNVGFAIPINLAMQVAGQLQRTGRVAQGFLGVETQDIDSESASRLRLEVNAGALVQVVVRGSPAEQAGIKAGDIIVEVAERKIDRKNALAQTIATIEPGAKVKLVFLRKGQRMETHAVVAERANGVALKVLAVVVTPLDPAAARAVGLRDGQGLRIVYVDPRGPTSGDLREGDIIMAVERLPATVTVMNKFERALLAGGGGRLTVSRAGRQLTITLSG